MSVVPNESVENQVSGHMDPGAANSLLEQRHTIAVIIPCFNEGHSIAEVVRGFRAVLPNARIYVFDNNSTDETIAIARASGALVRREKLQGKGHVVGRMVFDVGADADVIAGGGATSCATHSNPTVETP